MPRARNPQTGEIIEWDGSAWVPYKEPVEEEDLQFERNLQAQEANKSKLTAANFRRSDEIPSSNPAPGEPGGPPPRADAMAPAVALGAGVPLAGSIPSSGAVGSVMRHIAPRFQPRTLGQLAKAAAAGAGIETLAGGDPKRGVIEGLMIASIGGAAGPFMKFGLKRGVIDTVAGIPQKSGRAAKVIKMTPKVAKAAEKAGEKMVTLFRGVNPDELAGAPRKVAAKWFTDVEKIAAEYAGPNGKIVKINIPASEAAKYLHGDYGVAGAKTYSVPAKLLEVASSMAAKIAPEETEIIRKLSMLAKSSGANKEAVEQAAKNIFGEERYKEIMKMIMASTTRMP